MPVDRYGRRRGVPSDIGFDRAGPGARAELVSPPPSRDRFGPRGPHARDARVGPPADIGYDRAGGYGTANDMRQILNRAGSSEDKFRDYINNVGRPRSYPPASIGDDPVWRRGLGGLPEEAGLWQDIKKILKRTKNPDPLIDQWTDHWNEQQMAYNVGDTYPLEGKPGYGTRGPFTITPRNLPELQTIPLDEQFDMWGNPIGRDDYGYFDEDFVARGGLMSLRR